MRRLLGLSVLILMGSLGAAKPSERPRLTYYGLGDIRVGMDEVEAKKLGFKVETQGLWDKIGDDVYAGCHYLSDAPNYSGVSLMVNDGQVTRVEVNYDSPPGYWKSHSGASNGMTEAEVRKIYGKALKVTPHPYLDNSGSYMTVTTRDGRYAMTFETSTSAGGSKATKAKRVNGFRAGYAGPVGFIEGCA